MVTQRLVDAITASIDPVSLMGRVAEQTCLFTPHASGAAVSLCMPDDTLVIVSAHGAAAPQLGQIVSRGQTFSDNALRSRRPEVVHDVLADQQVLVEVRALALELGVRSCIAIPLIHNDIAIGVLTVTAAQPSAFSRADIGALASMSRLVAALIGSHSEVSRLLGEVLMESGSTRQGYSTAEFLAELMIPGRAGDNRLHVALDGLFAPNGIRAVFQPIIDLRTHTITAVEGLCRFPSAPQLTTAQWFSRARLLRRGVDLEMRAVQAVIEASRNLPSTLTVAVNLSPLAALDPVIQQIVVAANRELIVEITEHEPFPDDLNGALEPLRCKGVRIAVDDAGAGYANLTEIMRLQPDIIKIDGKLTGGVERNPVRRALIYAIVQLADEIGATTVAEAVEEHGQCAVLCETGVTHGQGYLFGKPALADELASLVDAGGGLPTEDVPRGGGRSKD